LIQTNWSFFNFKHEVTARVGQKRARKRLSTHYKCTSQAQCELHRLLQNKKPDVYVLVTNVEVNAQFRAKFIRECKQHCPSINHYQIIGLDDLEIWVTSETELRHLFFPTLFGPLRFLLRIKLLQASPRGVDARQDKDGKHSLFIISVQNTGTVPSYIDAIGLEVLVNGERIKFTFRHTSNQLDTFVPVQGQHCQAESPSFDICLS